MKKNNSLTSSKKMLLSPSTAPSHVGELNSREAVNHKNRIVARCKDNLCNNTETQADHYRGAFEDENLVAYPTPYKGSEHGAVLTTSVHMHVTNLYSCRRKQCLNI